MKTSFRSSLALILSSALLLLSGASHAADPELRARDPSRQPALRRGALDGARDRRLHPEAAERRRTERGRAPRPRAGCAIRRARDDAAQSHDRRRHPGHRGQHLHAGDQRAHRVAQPLPRGDQQGEAGAQHGLDRAGEATERVGLGRPIEVAEGPGESPEVVLGGVVVGGVQPDQRIRQAGAAGDDQHTRPSATHAPGRQARAMVEAAREEVAALVGARAEQIADLVNRYKHL